MSISDHPDLLAFAYRNYLYIYNVTTYLTINNWTLILYRGLSCYASGLKLVPPYIIVGQATLTTNNANTVTDAYLFQFDIYQNSTTTAIVSYPVYSGFSLHQYAFLVN